MSKYLAWMFAALAAFTVNSAYADDYADDSSAYEEVEEFDDEVAVVDADDGE